MKKCCPFNNQALPTCLPSFKERNYLLKQIVQNSNVRLIEDETKVGYEGKWDK